MGLINTRVTESEKEVAKELFGKKYSDNLDKNVVYNHAEELILMTVKRLTYSGDVNGAEDVLFDNIDKTKGDNYVYIALEFYAILMSKTDEELKELDFSREEIFAGINDIKERLNII